jgi:4'-phosphopantetheinyl transferase
MPIISASRAVEQSAVIADLRYADWRQLPPINLDLAHGLLGNSLMERGRQKRIPEDRQRFLQAHLLLQNHVADCLQLPAHDVELVCLADQKPRLKSPDLPIDLSLTHAGKWIGSAVIIGPAKIGIDIAESGISQTDISLVQQFFASSEMVLLEKLASAQRQQAFLSYWTGKEAMIKALGLAIGVTLDAISLDLSPETLMPVAATLSNLAAGQKGKWGFLSHRLPDGSRLTAACHATSTDEPTWTLKMIDGS